VRRTAESNVKGTVEVVDNIVGMNVFAVTYNFEGIKLFLLWKSKEEESPSNEEEV